MLRQDYAVICDCNCHAVLYNCDATLGEMFVKAGDVRPEPHRCCTKQLHCAFAPNWPCAVCFETMTLDLGLFDNPDAASVVAKTGWSEGCVCWG